MGLYQRGSVWWVSFVFNGKRVRRSTETEDRKLAKRIYDKVKGEIAEGRWFEKLPGEDKTFKEMMEKYLKEHASRLKSFKSFEGYSKNLLSFFGDRFVKEITPRLINEFKQKRIMSGVKPSTINRDLATLRKAFNLAVKEWEWVKDSPMSKVSLERENNKRDRWLTFEEEDRLLQHCPPWLREIVMFALNTGMRMDEILSLAWKNVDLFRKTITVFESKNGEKRTIPMDEEIFEILKDKSRVRSIQTDLVFSSKNHTHFFRQNVGRVFRSALKKAKIDNFHFHDLRHTFATRLVQSGKVDLYAISKILGHKSISMTQRYSHHCVESLKEGMEVLDKINREHVTNLSQQGKQNSGHGI